MRRNRRVKIVATLGPASSAPETIERIFFAGADVFRINMSHSSREAARSLAGIVREVGAKHRHPIGILCDLQGPKLRVGDVHGGRVFLNEGAIFRFDRNPDLGTADRVFLPHSAIFEAAEPGHRLLIDDGKIRMRVLERRPDAVVAEVVTGGALASRKGLSLPDTLLAIGPLTEKDRTDLDWGLDIGADWIALSYVQRADDIIEAKRLIDGRSAVMVKIEKPSAIEDIDGIISAGDGFMVARGDLGVEMPIERVPGLQKQITRKARSAGKPIIVATQMLESMTSSPMPTRAEVSDVATAVFDGADAVMLSAESAIGQFPVEAIQMMDRIAIEVESDPSYDTLVHATQLVPQPTGADAIAAAAHAIAGTVNVAAILCYTATGSTALRVARERPNLPVIGLTPVVRTAQRLALVWGLQAVLTSDPEDLSDMVRKACRIAFDEGFVRPGDSVVITCGVPLGSPGTTNMIRLAFVDELGLPDGHSPDALPVDGKVPARRPGKLSIPGR
ncbi:MAG TPA: pyruvate kinase [Hyphomicrobiaceae bacterium]|nr:pyruvate kinase [Hyphomicrobiaceae bacterium]